MELMTWIRAQYDRIGAALAVLGGALALLLGWLGASRTVYATEQIPYLISGAALGIFLVGIGATMWLSADMRDEWRKLDRIERRLDDGTNTAVALDLDAARPASTRS